jgi:hypothetical protein
MQFINLFCCLLIVFSPIKGMERKRSGAKTEPKSKKSHRTDPEVRAELRILQNIYALHCYFKGIAATKSNPNGQ